MTQARADLEVIGFWKPERDARLAALARLRGEAADQTHRGPDDSRPQLLLDAGALISTEAHLHGKAIAECQLALLARRPALLPAVVFAQIWRASPRQHALSKIRQMCRVIPFTTRTADDVGRLLTRSRTADVVDAAVIVAALEHNTAVLTSNPKDLAKLASATEYPIRLLTV